MRWFGNIFWAQKQLRHNHLRRNLSNNLSWVKPSGTSNSQIVSLHENIQKLNKEKQMSQSRNSKVKWAACSNQTLQSFSSSPTTENILSKSLQTLKSYWGPPTAEIYSPSLSLKIGIPHKFTNNSKHICSPNFLRISHSRIPPHHGINKPLHYNLQCDRIEIRIKPAA